MFKIKIKHITPPDKSSVYIKHKTYKICIGNGKTLYFNSIRDASACLAQCNKLLNLALIEVNYLYMNLFCEYRRVWLYSDTMPEIQLIQQKLTLIESHINNAVIRTNGINGNHYPWSFLFKAIDIITECFSVIISNNETRGFYADAERCNLFIKQLKRLNDELNGIGSDQAEAIEFL